MQETLTDVYTVPLGAGPAATKAETKTGLTPRAAPPPPGQAR